MTNEELNQILSYHFWRQAVPLPDGTTTPGHVLPDLWTYLGLPANLEGKTFLDVGANDGMFSFEAERRGAREIVSSDLYKDSIDSMKNGWSSQGIDLLRKALGSKIQLHSEGVYSLNKLKKRFDVVFMNDIINWLEDIDLAVENLAAVTGGTLYLADGFLLKEDKPVREEQKDLSLRYMYNLSFIKLLLEKKGFRIKGVRSINYQSRFLDEYLYVPSVQLDPGKSVFELPDRNAVKRQCPDKVLRPDGRRNGFLHFNKIGWVAEVDVKSNYFRPSAAYRILRAIGFEKMYRAYLDKRERKRSGIGAFIIEAQKIT